MSYFFFVKDEYELADKLVHSYSRYKFHAPYGISEDKDIINIINTFVESMNNNELDKAKICFINSYKALKNKFGL